MVKLKLEAKGVIHVAASLVGRARSTVKVKKFPASGRIQWLEREEEVMTHHSWLGVNLSQLGRWLAAGSPNTDQPFRSRRENLYGAPTFSNDTIFSN